MIDVRASKSAPLRVADAEGSMEQAPLVYALVHALDRAITGEMVFRSPAGDAHAITFFEGAAVRVEPGVEGERIGEDLIAMDQLTEDALASAMATSQSSRRRLGELLIHAGTVEPSVLTHALALQTAKRLARLANLPPASTFSLYFSARADPEPYAPWAPLDMLLAAVRAWEDRSRLHGTLRWLADKPLHIAAEADLGSLMLTSREREAVAMMSAEAPTLKALYAAVGRGLSSLLYTLAVTRQLTATGSHGGPMGRRKQSDLVREAVQVAVPIAPVIVAAPEIPSDVYVPTPAHAMQPQPAPAPPPPVSPAAPGKKRISVPTSNVAAPAAAARAALGAEPSASPSAPEPPAAPPPPARPSFTPPTPARPSTGPATLEGTTLGVEFRRAEEAARLKEFETADRILKERCSEEEAAEPEFQALAAWIKAHLGSDPGTALNDLTFLLMSHDGCEGALYYRGLLLKRTGKEKAALRDFVVLAKRNPMHAGALAEIKLLRETMKKG